MRLKGKKNEGNETTNSILNHYLVWKRRRETREKKEEGETKKGREGRREAWKIKEGEMK